MKTCILAFLEKVCSEACKQAELEKLSLIPKTQHDNITLKNPRMEYEFFTQKARRTGRLLGICRRDGKRTVKKELYQIELDVQLTCYAKDKDYNARFADAFIRLLPRSFNDRQENFVKVKLLSVTPVQEEEKRIGDKVIKVNQSYLTQIMLGITRRITEERQENTITRINLNSIRINKDTL